jgi:hypothetical protein
MSANDALDFVTLESLVDKPVELNKQMRLDLIRLVDSIRQQMVENGSVGVQQQNQLVQALKMIKLFNAEIDKANLGNGSAMEALFQNLPFASDSKPRAESITKKLHFDDGIT